MPPTRGHRRTVRVRYMWAPEVRGLPTTGSSFVMEPSGEPALSVIIYSLSENYFKKKSKWKNKPDSSSTTLLHFQGQDLFSLLNIVIKMNGMRSGVSRAFPTTFWRHLCCSSDREAICSLIYCVRDLLIQSTRESVLYAGLGPPASYAPVSKISLPVSVYGPRG